MSDRPVSSTEPRYGSDSHQANGPTTSRIAILRESQTPLGLLELRRRWSIALERDVWEIMLNGNLMMSSAIHDSEDALAERGLAEAPGSNLNVLIGGLGLGFTARRVLADDRVQSVTVVELLSPIIDWHRDGTIDGSKGLLSDPRLQIVCDDFFALLTRPATPETAFELILIDIDDGPDDVWHDQHAEFYGLAGLQSAVEHLKSGGVLAFWFATRPSEDFLCRLGTVLSNVRIEAVRFFDPSLHGEWEHFLVLGANRRYELQIERDEID